MLKDLLANRLKEHLLHHKTIASSALKRLERSKRKKTKNSSLEAPLHEEVEAEAGGMTELPERDDLDLGLEGEAHDDFSDFDTQADDLVSEVLAETSTEEPPFGRPQTITLKSLRAVAQRISGAVQQHKGLSVLVSCEPPDYDITADVIDMAREIADAKVKTLLLDRSESLHVLSSTLGLPRTPGMRELLAGTARVEDVIKRDPESALQFISAGNPRLRLNPQASGIGLDDMIDALREVYDCVIIHADCNTARHLFTDCKEQLAAAVIIGGPQRPKRGKEAASARDFLGVDASEKTVIRYEQPNHHRTSLFGIRLVG